jgi:hypothetical protein
LTAWLGIFLFSQRGLQGGGNETMSTPTIKIEDNFTLTRKDDPPEISDEVLEVFLDRIKFFPTPPDIARQILEVNKKYGDYAVELQLGDSCSALGEYPQVMVEEGWVRTIVDRVSSILFREEETENDNDYQPTLEASFDKIVSEKIYDRLSFLSLSPQAKSGGVFSLKRELTYGIAEDVGLGLWKRPPTSATHEALNLQAGEVLINLAGEFQDWLVYDCKGVYPAKWGNICAQTDSRVSLPNGLIVWLTPDARQVTELDARRVTAAPASA